MLKKEKGKEIKKEIKKFLDLEVINSTSLFGAYIVDINTYELEYFNEVVRSTMFKPNAKYCWEAIYGLEAPCEWCKISHLVNENKKSNNKTVTSELFNEVNDKWYQLQEQVININENLTIKNAFAIDISEQKEAQGKLIKTNVMLSLQKKELKEMQKELKELSIRDPLTNLFNRRYLSEISKELMLIAKREEQPLCVLMIDIDKFKNINDTYGHDIGDDVIRLLSELLVNNFRESDVISRLGGEEFAVILPNTNVSDGKSLAEKIRKVIEREEVVVKNLDILKFTISIGVSEYISSLNYSFDDILKNADEGLYKAKESGRNKVVLN